MSKYIKKPPKNYFDGINEVEDRIWNALNAIADLMHNELARSDDPEKAKAKLVAAEKAVKLAAKSFNNPSYNVNDAVAPYFKDECWKRHIRFEPMIDDLFEIVLAIKEMHF